MQTEVPAEVRLTDVLGARSSFAPTVTMPGGGTVTPEGWMWVLGFALAGCEWAIEAAERDGLQQRAMDYERRRRIYWKEQEVRALESRLAAEKEKLAALMAPNAGAEPREASASGNLLAINTVAESKGT